MGRAKPTPGSAHSWALCSPNGGQCLSIGSSQVTCLSLKNASHPTGPTLNLGASGGHVCDENPGEKRQWLIWDPQQSWVNPLVVNWSSLSLLFFLCFSSWEAPRSLENIQLEAELVSHPSSQLSLGRSSCHCRVREKLPCAQRRSVLTIANSCITKCFSTASPNPGFHSKDAVPPFHYPEVWFSDAITGIDTYPQATHLWSPSTQTSLFQQVLPFTPALLVFFSA